ncbi:carbohydrate ABC transporter permease [Mycetocola saprophilus]|uniref:carbohydrate ABC transporter permease n=1 Tax=Mycetocola saprophilus TaxID=76636 RepID=UPI0004C1E9E9|nr:sugar ABC transporter permease [Mycetocola saprophilus]
MNATSTLLPPDAQSRPAGDTRAPHTPPPTGRGPRRRRNLAPFALLAPGGILLALVTLAPIVFVVFISFTDFGQRSLFTGAFAGVGFDQYTALLGDPEFWYSVLRTIGFTVALVAGSVLIGMGISHLLTRLNTGMRLAVTIVLICAWAMPNVAASLVWTWLFQPGYGVMNWLLTQLHVFGDMTNTNWANDPVLAYTSIWMLVVWQAVPFIALTLNAAETQVPGEYIEAARLDGAGEFRIYRTVTLQHMKPTLFLVTILSVIWDFNIFNQIWLVSSGGPDGATSTLGVFMYTTAFVGFDIARGAAIAVVTTLMLLGLTAVYIRSLIRSGEEL